MFHCKPYLIAFAFSFFVGLPLFSIFQAMISNNNNMNHASIVAVVGSRQNFSLHLSKQKQKQ